jgi:mono/diheme cytochrome c family protein
MRLWSLCLAAGLMTPVPLRAAPPVPRKGEVIDRAGDAWDIPDGASARRNPMAVSEETLREGHQLWIAHCQSCHGVEGRGDGPDARLHERRKGHAPRNLTDPDVQENLTDGDIFYRISNGIIERDKNNIIMPAFSDKVPSEGGRWRLVLFVRTLGRAGR